MITVPASTLAWVRARGALPALSRLAQLHRQWSTRLLAGATGCRLDQAQALLWLLWFHQAAEPVLLAYHHHPGEDIPVPFLQTRLAAAPPPLPLTCADCGEEVEDRDLSYEIAFILAPDLQFT